MFPRTHTDWSDPRFSKWKLPEKFNAEQQDAFLECNESEIAAKPLTDDEVMSAFQQFNCRVDMRAGNICYKAEQKWPRTIFRKREFSELNKDDRNKLYEMLAQEGAAIYNDCVDVVRVKRRCKKARDEVLAPFFEERVLKLRYHAVMKPPPNESNASTLPSFWSSLPSFWSDQTAIGTATLDFNASSRDNPSPDSDADEIAADMEKRHSDLETPVLHSHHVARRSSRIRNNRARIAGLADAVDLDASLNLPGAITSTPLHP